jgi:hypothetical protein
VHPADQIALVADQSLISAENTAIAFPVGAAAVRAATTACPGTSFSSSTYDDDGVDTALSPVHESQFLFPNINVE